MRLHDPLGVRQIFRPYKFFSHSTLSMYICHLDGPIHADRFADSRESPDSRESFQGSRTAELNPCFANRAFGGLKIANRRFEAIRVNRSHVMKIGLFLRIVGPS